MSQVKLKDIARELGLSVPTVNRALINKGRIREETKQLVLQKAREMGYEPNLSARSLSVREKLTIALIVPDDFFFVDVVRGVKACLREVEHYKVTVVFKLAGHNVSDQLEKLDECANEGIRGVLLSATPSPLLNDAIHRLKSMGIPTVTVTNDAPQSDRLAYVGQNNSVAGRMVAEIFARTLPAKARVACLASNENALGLRERTQSFLAASRRSRADIETLDPFDFSPGDKGSSETMLHNMLSQHVSAIYANNMEGTLTMGRVLEKENAHLLTIGHDINQEIAGHLKSGYLHASLYQNPYAQGYQALKLLFEHLVMGREVLRVLRYIPTQFMMHANLEELEYDRN